MWNLHLNLTQDIGHGITIIFLCCVLVIVACLIDLWLGMDLKRLGIENPYPESKNPESLEIHPTADGLKM